MMNNKELTVFRVLGPSAAIGVPAASAVVVLVVAVVDDPDVPGEGGRRGRGHGLLIVLVIH